MEQAKMSKLFDDFKIIKSKLPTRYRTYFDYLILTLYLNITQSEHLNKVSNKGIKYHFIKFIHSFLAFRELYKKNLSKGVVVFVTETNHLQQTIPVTNILKEKYNVTYISNKKKVLNNSLLDEYDKLQLYQPAVKKGDFDEIKMIQTALKETLSDSKLNYLNEKDALLIAEIINDNWFYLKKLESYWLRIIHKLKPRVVLIGYDIPVEARILTELSNVQNIPTVMIQHGAITKVDGIFGVHSCKNILAYGEVSEQVLKASGCQSNIKITGAPYLDNVSTVRNTINDKQKHKLKVLVAFSGPGHLTTMEHHKNCISTIIEIASKHPNDIEFFCKLHPKDSKTHYTDAMDGKTLSNFFFSLPDDSGLNKDIFTWINFCDIIITGASTVAVEAMLFEKHIVSLDLTGDYKDLTFNSERAVVYVTNKEKLSILMSEGVENRFDIFSEVKPMARTYIKRLFGTLDGMSAYRSADFIEQYLKN